MLPHHSFPPTSSRSQLTNEKEKRTTFQGCFNYLYYF